MFPNNNKIEHILIKVVLLNKFYSTNIKATRAVADNILKLQIDKSLDEGKENIVEKIANVSFKDSKTKKIINKRFYSFATKYCHKSKPDSYPIYDSNVDYILRKYRKENREHFKFSNADLKDYKEFKKIINDFRDYYKLDSLNYRRLDHFLWIYGKDEKNKQKKKKS